VGRVLQEDVTQNPQGDAGQNLNTGSGSLTPEQMKQKYEELSKTHQTSQEKWELDMNRLKSSLQSNAAKERNEMSRQIQELQNRLHEATTKGMTEEQRREYELSRMQERYNEMETQYQQTQQQLQERQNVISIRDAFVSRYGKYGITADDIDLSNSDAAVASGWSALDKILSGKKPTASNAPDGGKTVVNETTSTKVLGEGGKVPSTTQDPLLLLRKHVAAQRGLDVKDVPEYEIVSLMTQGAIDVDEILSQSM
jgi:hypothetical protein